MLPALYPGAHFLNADEISRETVPHRLAVSSGRELLRRLDTLVQQREPFAIETTLSSSFYEKHIRQWQDIGYAVSLHFIELPSEDLAVERVALRVAAGGHSIPEADIRRRYHRGKRLFRARYQALVNEWYLWASDTEGMHLVSQSTEQN